MEAITPAATTAANLDARSDVKSARTRTPKLRILPVEEREKSDLTEKNSIPRGIKASVGNRPQTFPVHYNNQVYVVDFLSNR
jgi:hypothetical protein